MLKRITRWLTVAGLCATAWQAQAQEKIALSFGQVFAESHYIWQHGGKVFADRVAELTNGQVNFTLYPGGQLGKDYVSLLQTGLVDSVLLVPSVTADKLPLSSVAELPEVLHNSCEATQKYWSLIREGGLIYKDEYAAKGIRPLFVSVLPSYRILTTNIPLENMEAVKNLKIRGIGAAMDKTVRALGAVTIQVPSPEIYDALTRSTIDGALWGYLSSPPFGLVATFKHGLEGPSLGSASVVFAISQKKWDSLPADVREKMDRAAMEAQNSLCKWTAEEDARVRQEMIDKHGYKPTILSEPDTKKWQDVVASVGNSWAQEMDAKGKPGSGILKAYREANGTD